MSVDTKQITGADATIAALKELDNKVAGKVIASANRAGARVLLDEAKADAPVRTGFLKSKLKIRASNKRSKGIYRASVGVGAKDFKGDEFYAAFVLWGHKVGSRKLGDARKEVPANDFIARAGDAKGEAAADTVIDKLGEGVAKAWEES